MSGDTPSKRRKAPRSTDVDGAVEVDATARVPARVWVEDDVWDALLVAYRDRPGDATFAAAHAGIPRATAMIAWDRGMSRAGRPDRPAIVQVLRAEIEAARAARIVEERALLNQDEERKLQAKRDAVEARKEELQLAKVARRNSLMLGVAVNRLADASQVIAKELADRVKAGIQHTSLDELSRMLRLAAYIARQSGLVMEQTLRIERIVAGEPTEWVGLKTDGATRADVLAELDLTLSAMKSQMAGTAAIRLPSVEAIDPKKDKPS